MRFAGFLRVKSILGIPTFREPCNPLHQDEEQPDTELFLRVVSFLYYATCWSDKGEKRELWGGGSGGIDQSSITGKMIFHILFML